MKMDLGSVDRTLQGDIGHHSAKGMRCHNEGSLEEAIGHFEKAYQLSRDLKNDEVERTCAFNLGAAYTANENPSEGLKYLHKATLPPDQQGDGQSNADLYFNIGLSFEKVPESEKALEFYDKSYKEYEKHAGASSADVEQQIQCLEKCLSIHVKNNSSAGCIRVCQQMADVYDKGKFPIKRAEKLAEKALHTRLSKRDDASADHAPVFDIAIECQNIINDAHPQGDDCMLAGKILNDVGLLMTQIQKYDDALKCFEKAVELVRTSNKDNAQLEAVVLQNLGAAYNFVQEYQRAVKFHEDAADLYAKVGFRNGQGMCFTNLAYAHSQLHHMKDAEIAFHHALLVAKDTKDEHMRWQAYEGLGAVCFNMGNVKDAEKHFLNALKYVKHNGTAEERIALKYKHAVYVQQSGRMYNGTMMVTGGDGYIDQDSRMGMHHDQTHFGSTPRDMGGTLSDLERQIIPKENLPLAGELPAMSNIQESPQKARRGMIPMRKRDSFGPHLPKVSRGLATMTPTLGMDSPRFRQSGYMRVHESLIESNSTEESGSSSEGSSSGSDDDSSDDDEGEEAPSADSERITSEKLDQIFAKKPMSETISRQQSAAGQVDDLQELYQKRIEEKEEAEAEEESSSETSDSDSDSETSSSEEDTETVNSRPPTLPGFSPPHTGTDLLTSDTYLKPHPQHDPFNTDMKQVHNSPTHSFNRPVDANRTESRYPQGQGQIEDEEPPYATIGSIERTQEHHQGNDNNGTERPRRSSEKSNESRSKRQNYFDSEESESNQNTARPHSNGHHDDKVASDDDTVTSAEGQGSDPSRNQNEAESAGGLSLGDMSRGQREKFLHEQHRAHQAQQEHQAPEPPPRTDEKQSKTCVIM